MDTSPLAAPLDTDSAAALGTTVCVWAHPDDESYLSAGLLAALSAAGRPATVVTATRGEAGPTGPPPAAGSGGAGSGGDGSSGAGPAGAGPAGSPSWAALPPPSRADELAAALRVLGVADHHQLGFPDGGCADVAPAAGAAAVRRVLGAVRPDTVVTFGPDGFTGHPDHVAAGLWTRRALRDLGWTGRLLHPVMTPDDRAAGRDVADLFGVYALGEPRLCRPEALAVRLELAGEPLARKVAALRAHRSQTAVLLDVLGVERYAAWVGVESFVEAPLRP